MAQDNSEHTWRGDFKDALVEVGQKNMDEESSDVAVGNLADTIADAIESFGEQGGGDEGWKKAIKEESDERQKADNNLASSFNSRVDTVAHDLSSETTRASAAEKSNADAISSHTSSTSNPHSVTAEQVGAYTKEQVDGFIRNWSGYVVIPFGQSKPAASEAQLGKIYLVQVSNDPEVKDQYEEWISDGTAWSLIGTMSIDLSPYDKIVDAQAREKAINDALTAHKNDAVSHITSDERTKWNGKQDAIADLDSIRSGAALGATALQSLPAHNHDDRYYTESEIDIKLSEKGTYSKPSGGIPKSDLASSVQTSLSKADTALQSFTETDPTVPSWAKQANKPTYTASEVGALTKTDADGYYQPKGSYATAEQGAKADTAVQPSAITDMETKTHASATYQAKESGKGLSTNDYTTAEKNKLSGIASGAEVNVQSDWNTTDTGADSYIKNKPSTFTPSAHTHPASEVTGLATVATSGSYNDLSNKPTSIGSADKLTTARTIAISGGATGTATSFNGTANISIPVTSMRENYIAWGGQDRTEPTPCDCGSIDEFGHNKLSFLPPDCIKVEYTNDGGETWLDYEASDNSKTKFVTTSGEGYILAKGSSDVDARPAQGGTLTNDNVANYMVRITVSSRRAGATNGSIYTRCVKLLINFSTNGATGCWVTAEKRSIDDYNNNTDTWLPVFSKRAIAGWSGWNSYPYSRVFGGGSNQTNQDADLRLTFGATSVNSSYSCRFSVIDLRMIGMTNWIMPSELARAGHLYQIISDKTAIFPKQLYVNDTKLVYAEDGKDVSIADGGTGASTANGAMANLIRGMSDWTTPVDTEFFPSASARGQGKYTFLKLYNYIKSKLGLLATKSSVADADINGTISDTHIASASTWNGYATTIAGKQDALTFTTEDEITEILGGLE